MLFFYNKLALIVFLINCQHVFWDICIIIEPNLKNSILAQYKKESSLVAMSKENTGSRIKSLRLAKDISMAELAALAGVSKSLISQLERGDIYPSLITLEKIAEVLDVSLSQFFQVESSEDAQDSFVVRSGLQKMVLTPKSNNKYYVLTPNLKDFGLEFLIVEYPPNPTTSQLDHFRHEGKEYFYVLEGDLRLEVGGVVNDIHAGDSGCFDSGLDHSYMNLGTKPAKVLVASDTSIL